MDRDKDKDIRFGKRPGVSSAQKAEDVPKIGPHNPALGEIYQRLYPEMRRPKPNQEAIAAALQAMQRLTMQADSETAAEDTAAETGAEESNPCQVCGHHNRPGNKYCGACGLPLDGEKPEEGQPGAKSESSVVRSEQLVSSESADLQEHSGQSTPQAFQQAPPQTFPQASPQSRPVETEIAQEVHPEPGGPVGTHHYHHHYHHHYFQGGAEISTGSAPRPNASESAREADRLRVVAAAKGEPMSRGEAAVRRLTQEWILACNTRQLDELLELYSPDALVLRSNLPPIRGVMAVREFFHGALEAGLGEVALDPIRVEVLGDLAHEVGRYSALVPGTVGKRREERGKYLWVFAKQASGDWKLVSECWSSDLTLSDAESDAPKAVVASTKQPRRG